MRFAAAVVLAVLLGCASEPDSEDRTLGLFDRIPFLVESYNMALTDDDPARTEIVARDVRRLTDEYYEDIVRELGGENVVRRQASAFALGFSEKRAAVEPLLNATGDVDMVVRANALASLGILRFGDIPLDAFKKGLDDTEEMVRMSALFGLRSLVTERTDDQALLAQIYGRLEDASSDVRNETLVLLRKIRRKDSIPAILGRLKDEELLVRANATVTLGVFGRDAFEATPDLIETLRDRSPKVVESACAALNRIHGKDLDRSYASWRGWFEEEQKHCYVCKAHPDQTQAMPGKCPVCQAKLERALREGEVEEGPDDGIVYTCPVHPEVQTRQSAVCGRAGCGKDLVRQKKKDAAVEPEKPK